MPRTSIIVILLSLMIALPAWAGDINVAPLVKAARKGDTATVKALLDRGAKVKTKFGWTGLGWAALESAAGMGHTATMQALLDRGADVNAKDKRDMTALMWAASRHTAIVATMQALLDRGAEVNAKDWLGKTALMYATQKGHTKIVELLKQHGATE